MVQQVTFITAGQTPRTGMLRETMSFVRRGCRAVEFGALDGLSDRRIRALAPRRGEDAITTRLHDGRSVVVSEYWLRQRIRQLCALRGRTSSDITVIGSTGIFDMNGLGPFVIHAHDSIEQIIETLVLAGQRVGEILPLSEQVRARAREADRKTIGVQAKSNDLDALRAASKGLAACDLVVMHSMGYSERDRAVVAEQSGKPVILVRRLVAGMLTRALDTRQPIAGAPDPDGLETRLDLLTRRERQVFDRVVMGLSNKEIAGLLGISHRTVEIHRARMMAKLGAASAVDLVRMTMTPGEGRMH